MVKKPAFNFIENEWMTPQTYNRNFMEPPERPGVYLLVKRTFSDDYKHVNYEILYVGSSKNLLQRYNKHPKISELTKIYGPCICFYFKEVQNYYYEVEKALIKATGARFNIQWR